MNEVIVICRSSRLRSQSSPRSPSPLRFGPTMAAAAGQNRERGGPDEGGRERERASDIISRVNRAENQIVFWILTLRSLSFLAPFLAVAAPAPARAGRGASLGNMLTLLASEGDNITAS